jgi:two-component system, cell cycle sensor histidine kinase and response regulator CckA
MHEGVFVGTVRPHSGEDGATLIANPALKQLFGHPADTPDAGVVPFASERFADPQARVDFLDRLASEGALTAYPVRMLRLDTAVIVVEITARAEIDRQRGVVLVEAVFRDTTEQRRLKDRSRDLYQQLLQAEKLAVLGQTISQVAHELNNPLATILSWAERLQEQPLDATSKRGADAIVAATERATRIVRDLLTYAKPRPSTRSMIDLNHVVRETLELRAEEQAANNIDVVKALAAGLPPIFADAHRIQQVLLNLMNNAEQAMVTSHGRGSLVVRTWHEASLNTVSFEVSDDGPGLAPEIRSKIFDAFFTTKPVGEGTGLGLAVAYNIVKDHGGRIRVESEPDRGTSFIVDLPVTATAEAPPAPAPAPPPKEAMRGASVLVVEDEQALASAMSEALQDAGLKVDVAGDGEDALARIRKGSYDAVICDLKMPRVSGMVIYRAIAAGTPSLARRVIFVTGDVAATDAERFLAESGCRWLVKPFRIGDLLRAVRDTLA